MTKKSRKEKIQEASDELLKLLREEYEEQPSNPLSSIIVAQELSSMEIKKLYNVER